MAVIQLKEGYEGKTGVEEVKNFCRERLPPYAVPKYLEFRRKMPLTVTEKLFKKALRDEAIAKMKSDGGNIL
jgi:long-chain acyl-CoA synthetase